MRPFIFSLLFVLFIPFGGHTQITIQHANNNSNQQQGHSAKPRMQVVFALDATGSMSGLISAAKDKIWSIVSSLTQSQVAPDIEVGLVFYRDRGDAFVTRRIQLTDSMDMVYSELMQIRAEGGGDGPESVNQGLNEAVEKFNWDQDTTTYKAVFLVGDFEPHMNYRNDVPYFVTCQVAKRRDIILNTILMGNNPVAEKIWKEIAKCNQGAFVNVDMNVNDISIQTPYDSLIAVLSDQLDDLRYYYGKSAQKITGNSYKEKGKQVATFSSVNVKAQRAEYNTHYYKTKGAIKQSELLSDLSSNNVRLDTLKQDELPDEFRNLSREAAVQLINEKAARRDSLQRMLTAEIAKRTKYIEAELAKRKTGEVENSFNNVIFKSIQTQTRKKKIVLEGKAKF